MAKWVVLLFVALLCASVRPEPPQRVIEDPPVILLHPTPPFLATGSRLSLACAAYGSPIPNITWSSPTQGVSDYGLLSATEESVNITETVIEDSSGIRYIVSILELCNSEPSHLTAHTYTCNATNGVTGVPLGSSSATFNIQPTALEPAVLVSHPNGSFEYGGRRISMTCAAFGSPAPDIVWRSPTLGIPSIQPLANANRSISIFTEEITNAHRDALVLSTLELCDHDPSIKDVEISCTTSNGITTDLLGNQSASFFLDPYVEISTFSYEQMPATAQLLITFLGVVDTNIFKCNLTALVFLNTSSPMDPYSAFFSPRYPGRCGQVTNNTLVAYLDSRDYVTLLSLGIFTSRTDSYLTWKETLLGPLLMVTETEIAYQPQTFLIQTHPVVLLEFDLDFNAGQLLIHFGSIIDIASIDISGVTMSNGNATQNVSLTGGEIVTDSYATTVCIDMTDEDLLNIQNREICTSLENCFATFASGFAADVFGNIGVLRTLQVSILRQEFVVPNPAIYLSVTTDYIGCAANVSLLPNEVYIVRETERIIRVDCHATGPDINPVLSWRQGGLLLNSIAPPFMNNWPYLSYAYCPEGMPVTYYGLFTCTSQRGERIEHYIHDINPFVGTTNDLISATLYDPIIIPVIFASIPQQSLDNVVLSFEPVNHSVPNLPEIQVANFNASILFDHALYSLEGSYNIVFNLTALDSVTYTTVAIEVIDPVVKIFPPVVVIEQLGQVTITCILTSLELPAHWTIGNREIQDGGPFTLSPPGLHHSLQVMLDASDQRLLQEPFSCSVEDPELNTTVASGVAPVYVVPDELTVWRNGLEQLLDNSLLLLDNEDDGSLNLRCLGTQGNYDLIWKTVGISELPQVISSTTPDVTISYVTNDANITLHDFRRFEGTLRCESQQSGLTISIHLTREENPRICGIDTDQIWNVTWASTIPGIFDAQPCPEVRGTPTTGLAYRYCSEGGTWEPVVNVSNCRSMAFETLQTEAEMLFGMSSSLDDDVRDMRVSTLGEALANATDPTPATSLFPLDLDTANNILDGVIGLLRENIAATRPASLHTELIDTFNNMLSASNEEGWRQLQEMKVGSQKLLYNAEQYGMYLTEALSTTSIDTNQYGTNIPLLRTNIMMEAQMLTQNQSQVTDVIYPVSDHPLSEKAQILLPARLLIDRGAKAVVNILFVNLEDFLPEVDESVGTVTATMVLSSQIVTEQITASQSEYAELHFSTHMIENSANPRCVFWNFSDPIGEGMWSTEGVETNTVEKTEDSFNLACTSQHFTSFAAIVSTSEVFMFTVPLYVGIGVLLLCSVVAAMALLIVCLISCAKEGFTGLHYFVRLSFASATISACIVILAGLTTALTTQGACTAVAALLQYFFTAAFSWLLCEAIVLIVMLSVRDYGSLSKCWWLAMFLLGWGLPAIATAISTGILHQEFGTSKHCWISFENRERSQLLWAFVGPILAIALMTGTFLVISLGCKITFLCRKLKDGSKRSDYIRAWILFFSTLLLVPLLGGTSAFGLLTVNEIWDISEWLFMAFSIATGVMFLLFTILVIATDQKVKEPAAKASDSLSGSRDAMYWSDTKPILPEGAGSSYELKEKDLEISTSDGERGPTVTATSTKTEIHKEDP